MNQLAIDYDDPCRNKHGADPESTAAFRSRRHAHSAIRETIFGLIAAAGSEGLTLDEIAAKLGVESGAISGRITELKKAERIADSRKRRPTRKGIAAKVYIVKGIA